MEPWLTTAELAEATNLSSDTIKRLRAEGVIRGYKVRRQLRFDLDEVKADLVRAESEFEFRRARGRLIKSGGPRRNERTPMKGKLGGE